MHQQRQHQQQQLRRYCSSSCVDSWPPAESKPTAAAAWAEPAILAAPAVRQEEAQAVWQEEAPAPLPGRSRRHASELGAQQEEEQAGACAEQEEALALNRIRRRLHR
jgi:hypothetical protein